MNATNAATLTRTGREYLRVSKDPSGRLISPEEQHGENADAAAGRGWTLGEPYTENGAVSASRYSRKARPGFDGLVRDLESGGFGADILILWSVSRGSRKSWEWLRLIEALHAAGVDVFATDTGRLYDMASYEDRKNLRDSASDAEYSSDEKSATVGRAMRSEARTGRPHGRITYGYTRTYRLDDGTPLAPGEYLLDPKARTRRVARQVEHPAEGAAVRLIFASIAAGESLRSIAAALAGDGPRPMMGATLAAAAAELTGEGAPSGAKWTPVRVRDIALNPAYAGKRMHRPDYRGGHQPEPAPADLTDAAWPALISYADWRAVAVTLRNPARSTTAGRGRQPQHLLSMVARCAHCPSFLSVRYSGGASGREAVYTCRDGGHVTVARDDLDGYVTDLILGRLADPAIYARMGTPEDSTALDAARDAEATVQAEYDDLTRLGRAGKISPVYVADVEPAILARLTAAAARVHELESPAGMTGLGLEPGADIAGRWAAAPLSARRALVRLVLDVAVTRAGRGNVPPVQDRTEITWHSTL